MWGLIALKLPPNYNQKCCLVIITYLLWNVQTCKMKCNLQLQKKKGFKREVFFFYSCKRQTQANHGKTVGLEEWRSAPGTARDFSFWSCVHFTQPYRTLILCHNVLNPLCKCCRHPRHTWTLHPRRHPLKYERIPCVALPPPWPLWDNFSITHHTPLKLWKKR